MNSSEGPYWKRAHRDSKFWIGLALMLVAIAFFALRWDMVLLPGH